MSLTLVEVRHRYGRATPLVLDGVQLCVAPGEAVALVGPSGSGKTTVLAIAGGLLAPSAGTVLLDGRPMDRHQLRRSVSWVFQGSNALLARTVLDNVVLRGLAQGRTRPDATVEARRHLAAVGLAHLGDRPARTLSGGELQRTCIARALMGDPALLCADEPSGQLDAAATRTVVRALVDGRHRRAMLLLATHDAAVAAACDRVVELVDGRLATAWSCGGAHR